MRPTPAPIPARRARYNLFGETDTLTIDGFTTSSVAPEEAVTMADPASKDELLNQAARDYKAFHETLTGLNEAHLTEVWLGTWSIKDIVAHISGWHREMGPALERLARGEKPVPPGVSYDDVDAWNARFAAAKQKASVADVLLEFDKSHEYFMHAAAGVPVERFQVGKTAWKLVDGNSAHHYREHAEQIRAWRRSHGV
jgi:hypothetical protein